MGTTSMSSKPASHTIFDTPILRAITKLIAITYLKIIGWETAGEVPKEPKFVLIAAPHTSNVDFPILMALAFRFGIRIHWIGKDSLFPGPARPVARYLGGIPVDRSKPGGMVGETIRTYDEADSLMIVIPVEGTRGITKGWKSGFYHIASGANIPVCCGFLDYKTKRGGFGPMISLTGDMDADMEAFREFYKDITGRHPDLTAPIRLGK
jgi:1-acyl-sn-glycerol-3-phosphate acyltransferase